MRMKKNKKWPSSLILPLALMLLFGSSYGCDEIAEIVPTPSKGFVKFYGGQQNQEGVDILPTGDGGYLLLGSTQSFRPERSDFDIYLVRTDSLGNALWTRTFGGPFDDRGVAIRELPTTGGYVLLGNRGQDVRGDRSKIWVMELSANGDSIWSLILHAERPSVETGSDIQLLPDQDGFILIGSTTEVDTTKNDYDPTTDFQDIYVARILRPQLPGDEPRLAFEQEHGFAQVDAGVGVRPFADGTYDILGNTIVDKNDPPRILFSKISRDGIPLIRTQFVGDKTNVNALSFEVDGNNYLVAGKVIVSETQSNFFWAIIDAAGVTVRDFSIPGTVQDELSQVVRIPTGFLLAGSTESLSENGQQNFFLRAVPEDPNAPLLWETVTGSPEDDDRMGRVIPTDGGYAFVGTSGFSNITNLSLIKVNQMGEL
jgi:hypothetical protein